MKERDLKKAYEDIKISEKEKAKIYNNIMEKRKKGFSWGPVLGFGFVALASFGVFMVANKTNPVDDNKTLEPTRVEKRNITLENNYSKEIIVNAKKYLKANKIDIEEIENGKELVIEGDKIVGKEEYNTCKGNLVITRYNNDFSYSTSVTCDGEDTGNSKKREYVIYDGILDDVYELDDYIAVASTITNKKSGFVTLDSDANFTVLNKDGKVVFNKLIESVYKDEDSTVEIKSVSKLNGNYYLILNMANEMNFKPSGAGSLKENYYLMVLDKDGKEISTELLVSKDGDKMFVDKFIGGTKDEVYYTGYAMNQTNYDTVFGIIKISEDNLEIIPYEITSEYPDSDIATNKVVTNYYDNNFYGYGYDKSFGKSSYYSARKIFKLDNKGNVVWEKEIDIEENIHKVFVDKYIYVLASKDSEFTFYKYSLDGERIAKNDLKDYDWVEDFYVDKDLVIKGTMDEQYFFEVLNDKLEVEKKVNIDNSDLDKKFEWKYMKYYKLNGDSINAAYSVSKNLQESESVLLVFNK